MAIALGTVGGAGTLAIATSGDAHAANGDPIVLGQSNTSSAVTRVTCSGNVVGLDVRSTSTGTAAHAITGLGVNAYGIVASSTGHNGAKFTTDAANRFGVWAENTSPTSGTGLAVFARNTSAQLGAGGATAIRGIQGAGAEALLLSVRAQRWPAAGEFAGPNGVIGASAQGGTGVIGHSEAGTGVLASTNTPGVDALYSAGNATVAGDLAVQGMVSKFGGSFRIDHPLDPQNRYLSHSFVESPDMMNVYNGVVDADDTGAATIDLPEWFETLNADYRYQLTPLGAAAPDLHVSAEVEDNRFAIAGAKSGQRVSWQVTGIRRDPWAEQNRIPVEHAKPDSERGTYLYPQGFGQPAELSLSADQTDRS
ncbi:hypothetical protein [Jiangella alba]|uniref:hypothetical protein n=1 Tax=Jiangella alba TaxID=561176 RepID=UPI00114D072A|nr:hypothetical protein [Jiangella alba]